jgi:hypothetical protein
VVVNYMREYQLGLGMPRSEVYNTTMYILVGFLAIGLVCNLLVKPLDPKWFMSEQELEEEKRLAHEQAVIADVGLDAAHARTEATPIVKVWLAWAVVGIPLAWGVYRTLLSAAKFFS